MTKIEKVKCEKLLDEAIERANDYHQEYAEYRRLRKKGKRVEAEACLRLADQEYGYAEGINQVLATLGFKHDSMKTLSELL